MNAMPMNREPHQPSPVTSDATAFRIARWPLHKFDVPMVLTVAEEQLMPLRLRLFNRAGGHEVRGDAFRVRTLDGQICVFGSNWSASLKLDEVHEVRAELRYEQGRTQAAMECFDGEKRCLLSVIGPGSECGSSGQAWCGLLTTLANLEPSEFAA